ncbi:MAG TPA: four helix bundle protein [Gemmatimonadales bacterium]|nr:four helix bundle protein [Gemmatimonadales bacterium]
MDPYERFDAWTRSHELAVAVHRATRNWPPDERFGLVAQVRRAAFSVPANIVEGRARRGPKEFRRFLDIAWASLAEVGYTLRYAHDVGYLTPEAHAELEHARAKAGRSLYALLRNMS